MARKLIDANVILRYLLRDVEDMAQESDRVIRDGAYTFPEVLAEVAYVLGSVYHVDRRQISEALLTALEWLDTPRHDMMVRALQIFAEVNLDFVDCVLAAANEIERAEVFTFDKKLNRRLNKHPKTTMR